MGITGNTAGKRYNAFKQKFDPTKMSKEEVLLYYCVQNINGTKVCTVTQLYKVYR